MRAVDVAVIGGGPAGYVAARRLGQLGIETVLVERAELGGTCLNRGCIPTKALYAATLPLGKRALYAHMGIELEARVDLPRLRGFVGEVVAKLREGVGRLLSAAGVEVLRGEAVLRGPGLVEVRGESAQLLRARAIVLATGSVPSELPSLPWDGERVWSSDHALALPRIPERLAVVGGGVVGLELATVYRRLGAQVTVVEMLEGLLPGVGLSRRGEALLRQALQRQGIAVRLRTAAVGLTPRGLLVRTAGGTEEIEAEAVLVAVGRRPLSFGLGLEELGVPLERGFVRTDERFRAGPGLYAIGDVRGGPLLAHKASHEGLALAEGLAAELRGQPAPPPPSAPVPQAVFTQPEVALVGASLDAPGLRVARFPFGALGRALAEGEPEGFVGLAVDAEGRVVGAEVVGPHAAELLGEVGLAVALGLRPEDLAHAVHAHPTFPEAIWEAAWQILGKPVHTL